ncbi:Asp23/Gls24 family envelope stress response protein [Nocardioides nanhaiensis]|uniref:Asp23/Gls24 family envelope stress response protein n=1 Tax=Nocardioides nanhaiensis TaxID=1476871 RepID=A0ABP8VVN0_9ACTN
MADQTLTAPGPVHAPRELAPPEDRGSLEVRLKAIRHVVERVALQTPGVVRHSTVLGRVSGGGSPHADVTMRGRSARIALRVAVVWPAPVTAVAAEVRDAVRSEAARLTGVHVETVDVEVYAVSDDDIDEPTRRRVE